MRTIFEYDSAFSHLKQLAFIINICGLRKFFDKKFCLRNIVQRPYQRFFTSAEMKHVTSDIK